MNGKSDMPVASAELIVGRGVQQKFVGPGAGLPPAIRAARLRVAQALREL